MSPRFIKYASQTGCAIVVLKLEAGTASIAYKLGDCWFEGMYRPPGFTRALVTAEEARLFDSLPLTDIEEALKK